MALKEVWDAGGVEVGVVVDGVGWSWESVGAEGGKRGGRTTTLFEVGTGLSREEGVKDCFFCSSIKASESRTIRASSCFESWTSLDR